MEPLAFLMGAVWSFPVAMLACIGVGVFIYMRRQNAANNNSQSFPTIPSTYNPPPVAPPQPINPPPVAAPPPVTTAPPDSEEVRELKQQVANLQTALLLAQEREADALRQLTAVQRDLLGTQQKLLDATSSASEAETLRGELAREKERVDRLLSRGLWDRIRNRQ